MVSLPRTMARQWARSFVLVYILSLFDYIAFLLIKSCYLIVVATERVSRLLLVIALAKYVFKTLTFKAFLFGLEM